MPLRHCFLAAEHPGIIYYIASFSSVMMIHRSKSIVNLNLHYQFVRKIRHRLFLSERNLFKTSGALSLIL